MDTLTHALTEMWGVTAQMAPYLLFGFLMAGLLSVWVTPAFVEEHLGKRGIRQVCKAALLGVPLPLCSCAVIPVAASLRRHGASRGATLSFVASTPQTGLDSIMVTQSLLGPVFVIVRVVTAFVSGVLGGVVSEVVVRERDGDEGETGGGEDGCGCHHCASGPRVHWFLRAFRYGFVDLARDIGRAIVLGIVVSGVLSAWVPDNYFADRLGPGLSSMLVMLLVGIPLYTCSSGSVPIALALIRMGLSPGAALVFLVTGPATNMATLTTMWRILGKRATAVYLLSIALCALAAGFVLNGLVLGETGVAAHTMHEGGLAWWHHVAGIVLAAVLVPSLLPRKERDSV